MQDDTGEHRSEPGPVHQGTRGHRADGHGHQHGAAGFETAEMAAFAELEGEVLTPLALDAIARLAEMAARQSLTVRRVLDLGCGPGVGTGLLAARFPAAEVVGVDASDAMLALAQARAERARPAAAADFRHLDLSGPLEGLGTADIVWMSMALHHVGDEAATLARVRGLLPPAGLLALVEHHQPLELLGAGPAASHPGFVARVADAWAVWFASMREGLPGATPSATYPDMLAAAGLDLVTDEVVSASLDAPLDERAQRFARRHLQHLRAQLADHLPSADVEVLDALLDGDGDGSLARDPHLRIVASRRLYLARPAS